jgi:uncharacterized repeat protein (TIGR01451 family)
LNYWNETTQEWQDVATSCTPTSTYIREPGMLKVTLCHLTEFALVTTETTQQLTITKQIRLENPSALHVGDNLSYDIVVTNLGDGPVTNLVIQDVLTNALQLASSTASTGSVSTTPQTDGTLVQVKIPTLSAKQKIQVGLVATVIDNAIGHSIVNTASVSYDGGLLFSDITTSPVVQKKSLAFVYLPTIVKTPPMVSGIVTYKGNPVVGTTLHLRYKTGSWSTYATTTSDSTGSYQFTNLPPLTTGQQFYVAWINKTDDSQLGGWACDSITTSTTNLEDYRCSFDVAYVVLASPDNNVTVALPKKFSWYKRSMTTDSYSLDLFDLNDSTLSWWYPQVGYVDSYTLNGLPSGFVPGKQYGWSVVVYGSDGVGYAYYYGKITFTNSGSRTVEASSLMIDKPIMEDSEMFRIK